MSGNEEINYAFFIGLLAFSASVLPTGQGL